MALPKTRVEFSDYHLDESPLAVSVIVALKDQADYLKELNSALIDMLEKKKNFEIIYVDDGSTDETWKILKELVHEFSFVKVIKLRTAFGESAVLEAAMEKARGESILFYTSRVRVNPKDLQNMLERLDDGADLVMGKREPRRDSLLNRMVSKSFNRITNKLTDIDLHDVNSGVVAVKKQVLDNVPFYGALNAFLPVLAARQGYKISEERVEQLAGKFANSLYPKDYVRRFLDLISVVFLSKYSKKPLHFLGFMGAILAGIGALIDLYLFVYRILGFGGIAGRPMLLLGTVMLVIGLQMIAVGLLGEMIIFTHARTIREYNIEEVIE